MPKPSLRTRSRKRKNQTLPGGKRKTLYRKERVASSKCRICGGSGSRTSRLKSRKLTCSQKRISRIYGSNVCQSCLRKSLRQATRELQS
ncbi:MAG: 50S ribosomal protein L34e [Candidatus Bathyarchaeota archaeon]|nr:MAG: 50S ribosomal protein L34e [Candidatus Bathyarchaeota archaeon]